jgi:hypothetical protein
MRLLLIVLLLINVSFSQDYVLICRGTYAYAYHRYQCSGLKHCKATIVRVTMQETLRMRRTPCENCYAGALAPSRVDSGASTTSRSVTSSSVETSSGQCNATTKKGTRCSRSVRSGGYCWQHVG